MVIMIISIEIRAIIMRSNDNIPKPITKNFNDNSESYPTTNTDY